MMWLTASSGVYVLPNEAERKIYLIPRAGDMQAPAQNALLKLLEEPPAYCAFLLMTENAERLLPTVRSRAVTLSLAPLPGELLLRQLEQRHPTMDREQLLQAADRSQGYLGQALEALETGKTRQDELLSAVIGALSGRDRLRLLEALLPLEKLKRDELIALLADLEQTLLQALDGSDTHGIQVRSLAEGRSGEALLKAARASARCVSLLQANVSAGHTVGWLITELI